MIRSAMFTAPTRKQAIRTFGNVIWIMGGLNMCARLAEILISQCKPPKPGNIGSPGVLYASPHTIAIDGDRVITITISKS